MNTKQCRVMRVTGSTARAIYFNRCNATAEKHAIDRMETLAIRMAEKDPGCEFEVYFDNILRSKHYGNESLIITSVEV